MLSKPRLNIYVRAIAFIMLFAMFHYVAGYRLMYSLGILYSKEEAKECVAEKGNNIQKLTLATSDFNALKWTEENKEFSLNNEMYDVVNIEKSGKNYIVTVYADDKETAWVASMHNFEKNFFHSDQSSKGAKSAESLMSSFQKEFTPSSEFKICIFSQKGLLLPIIADKQQSLHVSNNIWHPPATC